jgi:hypothetical protein
MSKTDARALKIHREFIGLCENAGKRAQIRVLRVGQTRREAGRTNRRTSVEVAGVAEQSRGYLERKTRVPSLA